MDVTKVFCTFAKNYANMTVREDREKAKMEKEILSKYFFDMSKTAFGTTVLTNVPALFGLADFTYRSVLLFLVGSIATYAFAYTGFKILKKK